MKTLLINAQTELATSQAEEKRLQARLDQLTGEMASTEESLKALTLARQSALRKAAIDATEVKIDRSGLSEMQSHRDELEEMAGAIRAALADIQKDRPRLVNSIGTAKRAFMAASAAARINRLFGKIRLEDLIDIYVLKMGAAAGGGAPKLNELIGVAWPPNSDEVSAAAARVKVEQGFDPY